MKKTLFLITVAVVMVFTGCQKESPLDNESKIAVLSASIEHQSEPGATKTYLDGTTVKWSAGDSITVFYSDNNGYRFNLTTGDGTPYANFTSVGTPSGTPQYAVYPYDSGASISGSDITFNLPATQTYAENSFEKGYNVAVAKVTASNMNFKNVCGVLRLSLKGHMKVSRIELEGNNGECLHGTFVADAALSEPIAVYSAGGGQTLTLDCTSFSDGSVQLSKTATDFYFVVPVGAFGDDTNGGFTATVYDVAGDSYKLELATSNKDNVINRSCVRAMPEMVASLLPSEYTEVEYIEGEGTQYLDSGLSMPDGYQVKVGFMLYPDGEGHIIGAHNLSSAGGYGRNCFGQTAGYRYAIELSCGSMLLQIRKTDSRYEGCCNKYIEWSACTAKSNIFVKADNVLLLSGVNTVATDILSDKTLLILNDHYSVNKVDPAEKGKLYWMRIFSPDGVDLKRYYVPCLKNSDSVRGLYDLVNGTFIINQATGNDFLYGTM